MKQTFTFFLFLSMSALFTREVELNRVRFIIDDVQYVWDRENDITGNIQRGGIEPEFLSGFLTYKPGDLLDLDKLEKEIEHVKLRLKDSGLFYSQQVSIVPPRKYPDKRTIVIKVTNGFRYRFGGGYAYGFFGNLNLWGRGDYILLAGGLNNVLVDYRRNGGSGKIYWGNKLFINPMESFGYNSIYAGYKITPDLSIGLDFKGKYKEVFYPSGGLSINLNKYLILGNSLIKYDIQAYGEMEYLNSRFTPDYSPSLSARYIPPIPLSLLVQVDYNHRESELFLGSYLFYHFESILLPPIDLKLSPFVFCEFLETRIGVGLEIYFDVPIFTRFTLTYGWDLQGKGNFIFS